MARGNPRHKSRPHPANVNSGAYPEDRHIVHMDPDQLTLFMKKVDAKS